jgi:RND family efflux transporter MFP subunit
MEKGLDTLEESTSQARKTVKRLEDAVDKILEKHGGNPPVDGAEDFEAYNQATAELEAAEKQYKSIKSQMDDMDETYDDQREKLESQLEIGKEMSTIAEKEVRENLAKLADAMVKMQEQNYQNALKKLDEAKVYAPISGTIRTKNVLDNNMISESTVAYEIFSSDSVSIEFGVSEKSISKLAVGDKVEVTHSGLDYIGTITEIPMMADSSTGLFSVKANIDTKGSRLLSGSVVKVKVPVDKSLQVITVPISCVYFEGDEHYIYVNDGGKAKKTEIETGVSNNELIEVVSGLTEADEIITTWHPNLVPGCKVEVVDASTEPKEEQEQKAEETVVVKEGNGQEDEAK